jgi:flagellin-specific chaperone FliS
MLAQRNPQTAYRRVEFDARVTTADPRQLVELCYEQLISALGTALFAQARRDNCMKSEALTRAVSALTALQLGVSGEGSMTDALNHIYIAARRSVLDSVLQFDAATIGTIRQDFVEIAQALGASRHLA